MDLKTLRSTTRVVKILHTMLRHNILSRFQDFFCWCLDICISYHIRRIDNPSKPKTRWNLEKSTACQRWLHTARRSSNVSFAVLILQSSRDFHYQFYLITVVDNHLKRYIYGILFSDPSEDAVIYNMYIKTGLIIFCPISMFVLFYC